MKIDFEKYIQCVKNTEKWAVNNWKKTLGEKDVQGHYKSLYFWLSVGNPLYAGRHKRHIVERFLQSDGDYRNSETVKGCELFPCSPPNQYIYMNGWLTVGMQRLGAYDIALKGLQFIEKFQDSRHGGFYYTFDPVQKRICKELMDSSSTASGGLALLACGRLEAARRAGDFLVRLFQLQPEPEKYYFSCMRPDGELHTDVFSSEDKWDPNGRKQKCLSAKADCSAELTWLIGKPTKFLTKLYTATGVAKYLEAAIWGFDFFHKLNENAWTNYASCKTMWSGAELYRITGEKRFAETAMRIADYYCETQSPSGIWIHKLWYKDESEQPLPMTLDITQEYGAEITDVIFDLASRQ